MNAVSSKSEQYRGPHMEAIKLKARIGAGAVVEWLEPLPHLPPGKVEIIVLYEEQQRLTAPDVAVVLHEKAPGDTHEETIDTQDIPLKADPEWLALTVDERAGRTRRDLSPDEVAARLQWIDAHAGCIHIAAEQAMELAMDEWIAEENLG